MHHHKIYTGEKLDKVSQSVKTFTENQSLLNHLRIYKSDTDNLSEQEVKVKEEEMDSDQSDIDNVWTKS